MPPEPLKRECEVSLTTHNRVQLLKTSAETRWRSQTLKLDPSLYAYKNVYYYLLKGDQG